MAIVWPLSLIVPI